MLNRIQQFLPGSLVFAQDFSGDGTPEVVRKHLVKFSNEGLLTRLSQGVYLLPKKLGEHGDILPPVEEIATALARRDKARIIPTGEVALWKLRLTTQVPLNHVYITDGPSRIIKVQGSNVKSKNSYSIKFKHGSPKNFALRGKISSLVIQALKVIGEKNLNKDVLGKIEALVIRENIDDLSHDLSIAPAWISKLIKKTFAPYKTMKVQ